MKILLTLILFGFSTATAQLVMADTNFVCKGAPVRLFINPTIFNDLNFCVERVGEREGLYYYASCNQISFDDAYAYARLLKGNLATADDENKNRFIAGLKQGFIKWLGYYQHPSFKGYNDPPDPSSGFGWMSGALAGYTRWSNEEPNNLEDSNPGKNVIIGCSNVSTAEWCDVDKNDGHLYIAIVESKSSVIPTLPVISITWENGSMDREIFVNPTESRYWKAAINIDGQIYIDSIYVEVPEVSLDFSSTGGCGDPFYWAPILSSNLPVEALQIQWKFGESTASNEKKPILSSMQAGGITGSVYIESKACGFLKDSSTIFRLDYPFLPTEPTVTELKLNQEFTIDPLNQKPRFLYDWKPTKGLNNSKLPTPTFMALDSITYVVDIDDGFGCITQEVFKFTIDPEIQVFMPEAFSPNNDGINDIYQIFTNTGFYGHLRNFKILNRWSQVIYESSKTWSWDGLAFGKPAIPGVYQYILNYEIEKVPYTKQGSITLIR